MKDDKVYFNHIFEEAKFITVETHNISFSDFVKDEKLKRAVVRSIEIIGEAVKQLSNETKKKYMEINWSDIAKMRDKVIHHYAGVNWKIVWDTVKNDVPTLKKVTEMELGRIHEQNKKRGFGRTL